MPHPTSPRGIVYQLPGINVQPLCRRIVTADQRLGQAVLVVDVVKAEAPFDAQAPSLAGPLMPLDVFHRRL